jgi:inorganic pyrophosphatase
MIKVLVQVEAGSCERLLYNEKTLECKGKELMPQPFPYPYGFIPGTSAADGGCVDCYIITRDMLKGGSIVECDPVGLMEQTEGDEVDHKVLAALPGQHVTPDQKLLEELQSFIYDLISSYPDANLRVGGIFPRDAALQHIQEFQDGH